MYIDFYKFTSKPFQLTPDTRYLFPSAGHKRALSYLLYGLEQKEGFVVITGEVGAGKTILVQTLFREIADLNLFRTSIAAMDLGDDGILPMVAAAFGLSYEHGNKAIILMEMQQALLSRPEYRDGALLVVDEAQSMNRKALEELRAISNLEQDGRALVQIFLVGQPELRNTLLSDGMEQMRQRVIASHKMGPLTASESHDYIVHRLRAGCWHGDPSLTPDVFRAAHNWSHGIPRLINLFMDRLLLYGYLEELHSISGSHVSAVIREMNNEISGSGTSVRHLHAASGTETTRTNDRERQLEKRLAALEAKIDRALKAEPGS